MGEAPCSCRLHFLHGRLKLSRPGLRLRQLSTELLDPLLAETEGDVPLEELPVGLVEVAAELLLVHDR